MASVLLQQEDEWTTAQRGEAQDDDVRWHCHTNLQPDMEDVRLLDIHLHWVGLWLLSHHLLAHALSVRVTRHRVDCPDRIRVDDQLQNDH